MSIRHLFTAVIAGPIGGFAFAAPQAARAAAHPLAASVNDMSAGRLGASLAALVGLAGVVVGGLALVHPAGRFGTGNGPLGAMTALVAGMIAIAVGGLVVATSSGGLGTGNGLGGAIVAVIVGLIATVLGALTMNRSDRTG